MMKTVKSCLLLLTSLSCATSYAVDYYVDAQTGADSNNGASATPFKTIQKCIDLAQAGETCFVKTGVYRETITSKRSGNSTNPIKIVADTGAMPILTGTDSISGWSVHSGNIHKATVGNKVYQLFTFNPGQFYDFPVDPSISPSELMVEARYPNVGSTVDGLFEKTEDSNFTTMTKNGSNGLTVTNLPSGNYAGAHVYAYGGPSNRRWWSNTANVASNTNNVLTTSTNMDGWINTQSGAAGAAGGNGNYDGYVYGVLAVLDAQKEWASDGNTLYFRPNNDTNPSEFVTEAKTRLYVVNFAHDYIELEGFRTFAGATLLSGNHITLKNMDMRYVNSNKHVQAGTNSNKGSVWSWPYTTTVQSSDPVSGIRFQGNNNKLVDSKVYYSMGEGITLTGNFSTIENNTIKYTNYMGHYAHGIQIVGNDNDVIGNTMSHTGRSLVRLHHTPSAKRWRINYNDVSHNALVNHDVGLITAWGNDSDGGEIAYNWVHEIGPHSFGIYMDNNNNEILIHHNVVWGGQPGRSIILLVPQEKIYVYNNTFVNGISKGWWNPDTGPNSYDQVQVYNNYYRGTYDFSGYTISQGFNVQASNDSLVQIPTADITSTANSEAKDMGIAIGETVYPGKTFPSVTQFAKGTPDVGAYEVGGVSWRPGVNRIENSSGSSVVNIDPFTTVEAESHDSQSGIQNETNGNITNVGYAQNGDWIKFDNMNFGNGNVIASFEVRAASATSGGTIEIRQGTNIGTLVGTCTIAGTNGWQTYQTTTCTGIQDITGIQNITLVFTGSGDLLNIDWFRFNEAIAANSQIEAENFDAQSGLQSESNGAGGNIGYIQNGDWAKYNNISFNNENRIKVRTASASSGGTIEVRTDSTTGILLGSCVVGGTGSWSSYAETTCNITATSGIKDIYLVFTGSGDLLNLDWFQFETQ